MAGYDVKIGTVWGKLDFPFLASGGSPASGVQGYEDITPSEQQFRNQEPGYADSSPYSSHTYSVQDGSFGKYKEVQAPQDLSRPYMCDLDNTRAGVLAPHLATGANIAWQNTPGGSSGALGSVRCMVNSPLYGLGLIVITTGGTDGGYWFYTWDSLNTRYSYAFRLNIPAALKEPVCQGISALMRARVHWPVLGQSGGIASLLVPLSGGGLINASLAYPQTAVLTGTHFWHTVMFGGYLFTFEQADATGAIPGMTISLRDKSTLAVLSPATLAGVPAPELGNANIQQTVDEVGMCYPPVILNGAVYFATDRGVYKMVFDEQNCRIIVVPLRTTFTRITSNPEVYQGSLYVGSGNTLWHWTPGQQEWTSQPVDDYGSVPLDRGGGVLCSLLTIGGHLYAGMQAHQGDTTNAALVRVDANGTWAIRHLSVSAGPAVGVLPTLTRGLQWYVDTYNSGNTPYTGIIIGNQPGKAVPIYEASRDAATLPAAQRYQDGLSHFWVSAWDDGGSYADIKATLKLAMDCADVSAAALIRIYYQTDSEDRNADSLDSASGGFGGTITDTLMSQQGQWHLAQKLNNATAGLTLVGTGYSGYVEKSLVSLALQYRRIRWAVEIVGDSTGVLYPRLYGMRFTYSETPAKYVLWNVRLRLMAGDPDLPASITYTDATTGLPVTLTPAQSAADVYATWNTLWGYSTAGTFVDFIDVNGGTRKVKITKFRYDLRDLADAASGIPVVGARRAQGIILQLALQEAESAA